ncbi:alpha/beta hydrolase [Rhizobium sp. AB2/73]|uniref:alpha/beta hydrolase n=1 Tax=Rhizobium sp. AB2/73 TaxID=2795216 RepID=UPI001C5F33AB|nr:alpha/beta hydrolase [Rhizobium sp. AB2/73]QYA11942.1 alpha/beta hydrolase [Rhizobium sp. AB2/73]UEQ82127.1 alpha/beta hydrolase [Rhizobium sp. AB2/73]
MASEQSLANKAYWEAAAKQGPLAPQAMIERVDIGWTSLSAEPGGVDYIEVDTGGVRAMWVRPKDAADDRVIFYAHGGGFVSGSIYTHRKMVGHLAKAVGCRALLFEYPYAHEQKYPAQLNATVAAYRWLLAEGVDPKHIAVAGDSAGAILTFGLLQQVRDDRMPLPAAVMILSGWLDLTLSAPSFDTNRGKDAFFTREVVGWLASNFLGDGDPHDPLASPLYADLKALPPIFLQAGGDEALVDESRMFAERARQAGVDVRLDVFPEMLHSFQMMAGRAPEADDAIQCLANWVRPKLGIDPVAREGARP